MKQHMKNTVTVFAPASVSNINCGFDIFGFALDEPGDEIVMTLNDSGKVTIDAITGDEGLLPKDTEKNTASAVVQLYLNQLGLQQGVGIVLHKKMPLNSGLGSSAASSVAALVAINTLMGNRLTRRELLPLAMEGERLACGNAHADNVAPSLFGGLVLLRGYNPPDTVQLPVPENLWCGVVHPDVSIPTREARQMLPTMIPLRDAVTQWGNVAGLVAGFYQNDLELIGRSMQDIIIEPVRAGRIPHFYAMRDLAMKAGAVGFGISGSGPTVFTFCESEKQAQLINEQLSSLLNEHAITNQCYVSKINQQGARIEPLTSDL
ncbi:MAG: homoserine kinase [Bacteroidetes bacterium]|nr:MAG: homoserine kinase [Bacteroidota bacterium]